MNKKYNSSLVKLVQILSDGHYHDGTSLGEALGMTRSAVWKAIKKLENYQIKIDSIKGKGYALLEPLILLDSKKIKKDLRQKIDLIVFESVSSTNTYFSEAKKNHAINICLAEQQTEGKGRLGREWYSPFGKNIYMSLLYPFKKDISELSGLSLVMSLAIMQTLKKLGIDDKLSVKWPNDLIYENKKLSGSLIEIQAETHGACYAVIGMGINVNMLESDYIAQAWTSLQKITGVYVDRNKLAASLINDSLDYLQRFELEGLSPFLDEWKQADCLTNKIIEVKNARGSIEGKVKGINHQGHLLLQLKDGDVQAISSGDTTVVKR